jgi:hypothetical protein
MSDTPFIISPAGFIVDVNFGGPFVPGSGSFGSSIVTPVTPGGVILTRGTGQQKISGVSGIQGTLECYFTTGAPGTACVVAMITNGAGFIGIGLDATNQPVGFVSDILGASVAQLTLPTGAIAAGTALTVRLVWNATTPQVLLEVSSKNAFPPSLAKWTPFAPTSLWGGSGGGLVQGFGDFNGTILRIQVANTADLLASASASSVPEDSAYATIRASSTMVAPAIAQYKAAAAISGTATMAVATHTAHNAVAAISGTATVAAAAVRLPAFTGVLGSRFAMGGHVQPGL